MQHFVREIRPSYPHVCLVVCALLFILQSQRSELGSVVRGIHEAFACEHFQFSGLVVEEVEF